MSKPGPGPGHHGFSEKRKKIKHVLIRTKGEKGRNRKAVYDSLDAKFGKSKRLKYKPYNR